MRISAEGAVLCWFRREEQSGRAEGETKAGDSSGRNPPTATLEKRQGEGRQEQTCFAAAFLLLCGCQSCCRGPGGGVRGANCRQKEKRRERVLMDSSGRGRGRERKRKELMGLGEGKGDEEYSRVAGTIVYGPIFLCCTHSVAIVLPCTTRGCCTKENSSGLY